MKRRIAAWLLLLTACFGARADEGMWMMNNINPKTMEIMKQLGKSANGSTGRLCGMQASAKTPPPRPYGRY